MQTVSQNKIFTNKDILHLIIPLVIELSLNLIIGMIDSIMVSSVGEAAISGVSLVDSIMQLLIYVFAAFASGGAVVIGQHLGAQNKERANQAAEGLIWMNMLGSAVMMIVMLLSGKWILTHVFGQVEAEVYYHAQRYFVAVIFSIPAIAIFEAGTAIFRTMNDSSITMKISFAMNVMNAIGNALLIYGFSMGTRGAAISTLLSRWSATIVILFLLRNTKRELNISNLLQHQFDCSMSKSILKFGIPNSVENAIFKFGKIIVLGLVALFGTTAISANAVAQNLVSIATIPGSAVELAVIPVIARCVGAEDYEQVRYYNKKLLAISYLFMFVWSLVMIGSLSPILLLYHLSAETKELVIILFVLHTMGSIILWPLSFILPASLKATGDMNFTMIISVISMWVFRFGGAYILSKLLGMGVVGVWIAMVILDWGFRSLAYGIRWKKIIKKYKRN